jgi:hypothetical protein
MQGRVRLEAWIFIPNRTKNVLAARRPADISDRIQARERLCRITVTVHLIQLSALSL